MKESEKKNVGIKIAKQSETISTISQRHKERRRGHPTSKISSFFISRVVF